MWQFFKTHALSLKLMCFNSLLGWWATVTLDQAVKVVTLCLLLAQLMFLLRKELFNRRTRHGNKTRSGSSGTGRGDAVRDQRPLEGGQRGDREDSEASQRSGDAT